MAYNTALNIKSPQKFNCYIRRPVCNASSGT